MTFAVFGIFEDRIFGTINRYIDAHTGWLLRSISPVFHHPTGIIGTAFIGTVTLLIVLAYVDTRPRVKPSLKFSSLYNGGLYHLQPNVIGTVLGFTNSETQFHTVANNVRAKITFQHVLGNRLVVTGVWLTLDPQTNAETYTDCVFIPMGSTARLVLVVSLNNVVGRYAASSPPPPMLDASHRLEFGEWSVEITLFGDNITATFEGTLSLNANGAIDFSME